ncbi:hypothetical protein [Novosphingobium sp.]|uniref:hypothetical protein n=1 Tax=Novosphingobium sp. TaxID=1874826 RepID=UPI003341C5F3
MAVLAAVLAPSVTVSMAQAATGQAGTAQPGAIPADKAATRGVIVLHPVAKPAPVPAPAPAPVPAPAPAPTPPPPPPPPPVVNTCDRPFVHTDVSLGTTGAFRNALRERLARKSGPVIVDIAEPFPVSGSTPADLAPWLAEVKASGGIVSVDTYCQASRGFFSFLRGLFGGPAQNPFAAADSYDAVLHVDGLVGVVTQVEFKPRAAQ